MRRYGLPADMQQDRYAFFSFHRGCRSFLRIQIGKLIQCLFDEIRAVH